MKWFFFIYRILLEKATCEILDSGNNLYTQLNHYLYAAVRMEFLCNRIIRNLLFY